MKPFSVIVAFESLFATEAFLSVTTRKYRSTRSSSGLVSQIISCPLLILALGDGEGDDDDDEMIDVNSLGDWRTFRMNMASVARSSSGSGLEWQTHTNEGGEVPPPKKSVSKLNEKLLKAQNPALADEYASNAWAHKTFQPELGGLVCRLPLEAEVYRNKSSKLGAMLLKTLQQSESDKSIPPESISTSSWYFGAQKIIEDQLAKIQKSSNANNEIDASKLTPESFEFLSMYLDNKSTWQEVCLVVEQDDDQGECTTLVLNRPISRKANEDLAKLILFGLKTSATSVSHRTQRLVNFLNAFEDTCVVYVGGPEEQEEPATLIHGISGLEGALELSPYSNIFQGGLEAAIKGIMAGKYDPLEFRFFIGKHKYKEKMLQRMVYAGKYQPVACARSIALKQCLSLPKPLWNEGERHLYNFKCCKNENLNKISCCLVTIAMIEKVMEMCGGELEELSKLELSKRRDIQVEENGTDEA